MLKRNSAHHSSDVFTVIRAEVRPTQRVNTKPHKVWLAVGYRLTERSYCLLI